MHVFYRCRVRGPHSPLRVSASFSRLYTPQRPRLKANKRQPIEVCGDERAKRRVMSVLSLAGWEPLDCGAADMAARLEPRGPRRRKHPRVAEYDAQDGMVVGQPRTESRL